MYPSAIQKAQNDKIERKKQISVDTEIPLEWSAHYDNFHQLSVLLEIKVTAPGWIQDPKFPDECLLVLKHPGRYTVLVHKYHKGVEETKQIYRNIVNLTVTNG